MRKLSNREAARRISSYGRPERLIIPERPRTKTGGNLIGDSKVLSKQMIKAHSVELQMNKLVISDKPTNLIKTKKSTLKPTFILKKKSNSRKSIAKLTPRSSKIIGSQKYSVEHKKTTTKKIYHRHLARAAKKAEALEKALLRHRLNLPKKTFDKNKILKFHLPAIIAASFVLLAGYIMLDSWMINNQIKNELAEMVKSQNANADSRQAAEGKDEIEPDKDALKNYKVAPDLPRVIYINKLRIAARVLPMSVNPDNSMQAPVNVFDAGWYTGGVKPGQAGVAIINGHASGPTRGGLFAYLNTLEVGDEIQIERGDGSRLNYEVVRKENKKLDNVDMTKIMTLADGVDEGANIITCGGEYLKDKKTYSERDIIFTKRIK